MARRDRYDLAVIGAGVIGLSCAWRAAEQGLEVLVVDPDPGAGASGVAAGMLAPVTEMHHGEKALLRLCLEAAETYPAFVAEVEEASGLRTGYRRCGTLAVALDAGDRAALDDRCAVQQRQGLEVVRLTGRECRAREPFLAPAVTGGLLVAGDHQVDSRRLVAALHAAAAASGAELVKGRASLDVDEDRVRGLQLPDGTALRAGRVLLAAGCRSGPDGGLSIEGVPADVAARLATDVLPPVRPVKGQILRLSVPAALRPLLSGTVRGTVRGSEVYLVPREDGELVVGATCEELGFDERVTAGAVYELLRDAQTLVPGVSELELVEASARLRPGTPDNAPIIGPTSLEGLLVATGHHRNGVLLAGVTGEAVARLLLDGAMPAPMEPFSPERFHSHSSRAEVSP